MKFITLISAGLIAAGSLTAVPADAQRHGYGRYHDGGYDHGYRGYRGGGGYRQGYRGGQRWRGGPRWNRGSRWGGSGYGRVTCRGGYYGRECYRTFR